MVGRSRHRDAIALLGALVLIVVPVLIVREIRSSDNQVDVATLYDTFLDVAALTVPLLAVLIQWWWKGRQALAAPATAGQVMAAADQLAVGMLDTWRMEATERRISVPAPVRVRWRWGPADVTPLPAQLNTTPVVGTGPRPLPEPNLDEPNPDSAAVLLDAGVVTRLHDEVYRKLPHGRLVLLGEGGAGKTGAMILLLLAALEHRSRVPEAQRGEFPVPVWLTLGGWDPATQTLHQWATATMYRDHPYLRAPDYGPDTAGELLRTGRVALFLDGLDEMAPATQHQALARVDQEGSGLRIVLSSRPDEYRNAIAGQRLHNAVVIEVQPVDPDEASAYLQHDQIGTQQERWAQVGDYLTQHPDSVTAHALNNPLTLSLARATYQDQDQDQDPTPLTDPVRFPTVTALREHLINRILITAYPDEHQRAHATRWLAWIAHHMGPDRDLAWWRIHTWVPRWQPRLVLGLGSGLASGLAVGLADGLVSGLTVGLAIGLAIGLVSGLAGRLAGRSVGRLAGGLMGGLMFGLAGGLVGGLTVGLTFGLLGGLASGLTARLMGGIGKRPQAIIPRWPRLRELPRLIASGLAIGLAGWLAVGVTLGLTGGLVAGLMFGLLDLWTVPLPTAATGTPDTTYRMDHRTSIVGGLAVGLAGGLAFGVKFELTLGLAFGLTFGLTGGLARGSTHMVELTQLILMITGAGRVNLMKLLKDAHQRQVLRQAGTVYQFRHAEFQEHLAKIHHQRTRPSANT